MEVAGLVELVGLEELAEWRQFATPQLHPLELVELVGSVEFGVGLMAEALWNVWSWWSSWLAGWLAGWLGIADVGGGGNSLVELGGPQLAAPTTRY